MTTATTPTPTTAELAHNALVAATDHIVKHYRGDLEIHDKNHINAHKGKPFIHIAYDTGTHLYACPDAYDSEAKPFIFSKAFDWFRARSNLSMIATFHLNETYVWHYWDGTSLHKIDRATATAIYAGEVKLRDEEYATAGDTLDERARRRAALRTATREVKGITLLLNH